MPRRGALVPSRPVVLNTPPVLQAMGREMARLVLSEECDNVVQFARRCANPGHPFESLLMVAWGMRVRQYPGQAWSDVQAGLQLESPPPWLDRLLLSAWGLSPVAGQRPGPPGRHHQCTAMPTSPDVCRGRSK